MFNKTIERSPAQHKLYVTDFKRCPEMMLDFQKMDKYFLGHPFRWLIFVDDENDIDFFITVDVLLSSNVILALDRRREFEGGQYELIQGENGHFIPGQLKVNSNLLFVVYKIKEYSTKLRVEKYGRWNETHGLTDERPSKIISWRRRNMQGELMTMVGVLLDNRTYQFFYTMRYQLSFDSLLTYSLLL